MASTAERVLWTITAPDADVICALGSDCARVTLSVTRGGDVLVREGHPDRASAYERARALRGEYDETIASEAGESRLVMPACVLRPWRPSDAPALAEHANDPSIGRNLRDGFPCPFTLDDAVRFIEHARGLQPPTRFAIVVSGEAVGSIGFSLHTNVERVSAEIGYWLGARFRGRGVMTDAVRAVTRYAIASHGLTRVYAVPYEWNPASFRVLEKAGFVCEGRMRRAAVKEGHVIDQFLYAFVVEEPGELPAEF
jgi:[ribosomal protein S5]-alanine N-acetyltransferase